MKFLDYEGLQTFWARIKTWIASAVTTNGPGVSKTVTGFNDGKVTYGNIQIAESQVTNLTGDLNAKAPIASPTFTGTPNAPTAATGTDTTQIATTAFVNAEIAAKMSESDAMTYKGTLAGGSTGDYGALTPAASKGDTYKVTAAGKIDGVVVEIGDMLICNTDSTAAATANNYATIAAKWDFIQTNIDGAVIGPDSSVDGHVVVFDGATGKLVKDSGFTIGKSVPSNAVFTDTKVTSVGNHYTPAEDTTKQLDADASGATAAWGIDVVKGVTIKRDAKGHVVGLAVDSGKIPANPNTDKKVQQDSNSEDKEFPLLAKYTNNTTNETNTAKYAGGVTVNPNKKQLTATKFKGALEGTADIAKAYDPTDTGTNSIASALALKADMVSDATAGNFAGLDANGNLTDSQSKATDFALATHSHGKVDGVELGGNGGIHHFGTCTTAGETAAKVATLADSMPFSLVTGASVFIKFENANTADNSTLSVNGTEAKNIYRYGTNSPGTSAAASWQAGSVVHLVYDGTAWYIAGWLNDNTTSPLLLGFAYATDTRASEVAPITAASATTTNYALKPCGLVAVKLNYKIFTTSTLKIDSASAKGIYIHGEEMTAESVKEIEAGDTAYFMYDGTRYQYLGSDRMSRRAVVGFTEVTGPDAKVQYIKGDGSAADLMVAITNAEIEALP